jgi:hypothetical protein
VETFLAVARERTKSSAIKKLCSKDWPKNSIKNNLNSSYRMQIALIKRFPHAPEIRVNIFGTRRRVLEKRRRKETDGRYRRRGPFWPWMRRRRAPSKCIRRHRRSDRWKRYATSRC